jgi:hypothetical protein
MFLSFYVLKNFQDLVMALQVLVMTFACGPLINFFFWLCVGWKMGLYLMVGAFFPWLQNFWSLCFVCVCVTLHKGKGLWVWKRGGEKEGGAFACAFLFFFLGV